jgi:hypothetical protein
MPASPPPLRRDTQSINAWLSRRECSPSPGPSSLSSQRLSPTFIDRRDREARSGSPSPSPIRSHFPPLDTSRPEDNMQSSYHQVHQVQPLDVSAAQSNLLDCVWAIQSLAKRCIDWLKPLQYANHETEKISEDLMVALNNVRPHLSCMDIS